VAQRINTHGLQVDTDLYDFITHRALPGTGVDADKFWAEFGAIVDQLTAENRGCWINEIAYRPRSTRGIDHTGATRTTR